MGTYLHISNVRLTFLDERTILFVPFFFAFLQHTSASITWFVWCMSSKAWLSRRVGVELSMFVVVFVLDTIFAQHHKLMHILSTLHATFEFDGCQPNLFCMYSTAYIIINNSCLAVRVRSGIFNDVELLFHKMFFTYTCKIPLYLLCLHYLHLSKYLSTHSMWIRTGLNKYER